MAGKNTSVFGICRSVSQLEQTVDELKRAGYRSDDISVLFPDTESTRDFAHEKHTKAPEGAVVGAGTGAIIGGALGWLAGIGALAIPGIGPFIASCKMTMSATPSLLSRSDRTCTDFPRSCSTSAFAV